MANLDQLKKIACDEIDKVSTDLHQVSKAIWEKPELCFNEFSAHDVLCEFLKKQGFTVEPKYQLETAFRAGYGDEGLKVAIICEYDALPDIGHACGHNLIAEVGAGAGVGIKAALQAAEKDGKKLGKVLVYGTPAEEGGNGKSLMINDFKAVDFAMMAHPANVNRVKGNFNALSKVTVKYIGKASHAAAGPWMGLNALDAAVMAYQNVSCLRQQMKPEWRVHGIITDGGTRTNIIPEMAALRFSARAPTTTELNELKRKITNCLEAGATATGCQVEIKWDPHSYDSMLTNRTLGSVYSTNCLKLGLEVPWEDSGPVESSASTDMGNVSHVTPSIHPLFYIGSKAVNHTREYTAAAGSEDAQQYTLNQAKALAMTTLDVFYHPEYIHKMRQDLKVDVQKENE